MRSIPQPVYTYTPGTGGKIEVLANGDGPPCSLVASQHGQGVIVGIHESDVAAEARKIFAALYEAAGLPVPIVLDRVGDGGFADWFRITSDREVLIDPYAALTFNAARSLAAAIVAAVERAENEPDPAEVRALADEIRKTLPAQWLSVNPDEPTSLARRILAAGYRPPERDQ